MYQPCNSQNSDCRINERNKEKKICSVKEEGKENNERAD